MGKVYYLKDSKKFWETREEARKARDAELTKLDFSEKVAITERLQADTEVLQSAKEKPKQFGLGEIPSDAMNELSLE